MNAPGKKPQAAETVEDVLAEMDKAREQNMRVWNAVSRTDPKHTKPVEFGRKFTAIDAHYQIQEATRQFGPIGEGWGYDTGDIAFADGLVIVPVTLWHGERANRFGPLYGSTTLHDSKGRIDKDAPKKATTDALTKALSQLGFNADVFLGKFDDNKYVAELKKEFEEPKAPANPTTGEEKPKGRQKLPDLDGKPAPYPFITHLMTAARQFVHTLEGIGDMGEFIAWSQTSEVQEFVAQCKRDLRSWYFGGDDAPGDWVPIKDQIRRRRMELEALEGVPAK